MSPAVRFGTAYYPEYQYPVPLDPARIERDLDLMAEARFTVVRVGESVWSTWEPEDGRFDLDWLLPVLDAAHARGIGVLLGTPTYALPMWLARRYPELAGAPATGQRLGWGARQEMDFTHAAFRFHAERVLRAVVGRHRDHPAVIGYQVDNEPGLRLLANEDVFQRFVEWLRRRYGSVEALNAEWGLVYWSHRLSDWADLWRPDGNAQPQYDLAWRRFQAELVTEYIGWQADLVRELVPGALVTTCISYDQPGVEDVDLAARLDVAAGNAYYGMQDSLAHPSAAPRATGPMGWVVQGPWAVTQLADLMWSSKQAPFLVTETNAGSIGFSSMNESPYDGQWRQAAWLLVAPGARMVEYWHWNTLPFGAETYWGGVLPHSGEPGRTYRELAVLGAELETAGPVFEGAEPEYDVAVLYDSDSKFALSSQAPFPAPGAIVDTDSYRRIVAAFSRGIFDAKRQERLVRPQQLLPSRGGRLSPADAALRYPVLVVAGLYTAADEDLDLLVDYAAAGGHLVVGPRTGYGDPEGRARSDAQPARLVAAAGVHYDELVTLLAPVPVTARSPEALAGSATGVVEGLVAGDATVLAGYDHPHLGRFAAVTTARHGAGRMTVVGTVPDQPLAEALARWIAPDPVAGFSPDGSVTVHSSRHADGSRLLVLHDWSWDSAGASVPSAATDLVSGEHLAPGTAVPIDPWGVRVLRVPADPSTYRGAR